MPREKKEVYRIVYAPDGQHWIDDKTNNYNNFQSAFDDAVVSTLYVPQGRAKIVNIKTGVVIWTSHPDVSRLPHLVK